MRVSEDASLDKGSLQKAPHPRSRIGCEINAEDPGGQGYTALALSLG